MTFYSRDGVLEFDFAVAPGADPQSIHLQTIGGNAEENAAGDLVVRAAKEDLITIKKPRAYQQGNELRDVAVKYARRGGELGLHLGAYDRTQQLIIDPALIFSTYITTNCPACSDMVNGMTVNGTGIYLTGYTTATVFPSYAGGPQAIQGAGTGFLLKLDPTGSHLIYQDYLAATPYSVSVDSTGSAYLTGVGVGANFPTTQGTFNPTLPPGAGACPGSLLSPSDCGVPFVTKFNPDGSTIEYSTLLQLLNSTGNNVNSDIITPVSSAVDANGALYITGSADSSGNCAGGRGRASRLYNAPLRHGWSVPNY